MVNEHVLLQFFQALSDENRLRVIGVLAALPQSAEQIAVSLGMELPAVKRHLRVLDRLNLVDKTPDGGIALNLDGLLRLRRGVFQTTGKPTRPKTEQEKAISSFFANDRLTDMPVQHKRKLIVLKELLRDVEPDRTYREKELNELIAKRYGDFCAIRRYWVDFGYMQRENGCYQLRPQEEWPRLVDGESNA